MKNQRNANSVTFGIAQYFASVGSIKLFLNFLIWFGILGSLGFFIEHPLNVPVDRHQLKLR